MSSIKIRFLENTNIRNSHTDLSSAPIGILFKGTEIEVENRLYNGVEINGVRTYFKDNKGWVYWSGKALILYKALPAPKGLPVEYDEDVEEIASWPIPLGEENPQKEESGIFENIEPAPTSIPEKKQPLFPRRPPAAPARESNFPPSEQPVFGIKPTAEKPVEKALQQSRIPTEFWQHRGLNGKGATVAILDTGVNLKHPDLQYSIAGSKSFLEEDPAMTDTDGQGTQSALAIAGNGNREQMGIAPGAQLLIGRIGRKAQSKISFHQLMDAIKWAVDSGANIVFVNAAIREFALQSHQKVKLQKLFSDSMQRGVLFIAPVGDSKFIKPENNYPAAFDHFLSVGSFGENGQRLPSSARSYTLDLLAPGGRFFSRQSARKTGQSAAFVVGVAALMYERILSTQPSVPVPYLMDLLRRTASPKGSSHNMESGYGIFDPVSAIEEIEMKVLRR